MLRFLLAACLAAALALPARAADVIGMVLDLQGPAEVTENGVAGKLQLLANLAPQTRIELPAGSKASLTLYATRSVYRLSGPIVVETARDGLTVLRGQAPEVKRMGEKLVSAPQTGTLIAGAYRMRNLRIAPPVVLTSPESGSVLLDTRPAFSWETADRGPYTLTLRAESGGLSYNARVEGRSWSLPEGIQLEHGKTYEWKVSYQTPNGEPRAAEGRFSLATRADAEQFAAMRPADGDPIEDWVFYAVLLRQHQVRDEARKAWQRIGVRRPDLARAAEPAR
jgi:hypothetical protein